MSTIADVLLVTSVYTEIYSATGIAPGTKLLIQNKARGQVNIQYGDSKPIDLNNDGFVIVEFGIWTIPAGNQKIWMKGPGPVAVDVSS